MSKLDKVVTGRKKTPLRYVIYGPEGVGKSTLAAHSQNPIFLDVEQGTGQIDCARYPLADDGSVSYADVLEALADLRESKHGFETVVIDTISSLQLLIYDHVCKRDSNKNKILRGIEDYGYGKGYQVALDEWRALCAELDMLRNRRNMNVILLGHADVRTFKNPEGPDYDRYSLRLHDKASGLIRQWADNVGFYRFEDQVDEKDSGKWGKSAVIGVYTGSRILCFRRTAVFDAKSRETLLPDLVEVKQGDPWGAMRMAANPTIEHVKELIWAEYNHRWMSGNNSATIKEKISNELEKAESIDSLTNLLFRMKG